MFSISELACASRRGIELISIAWFGMSFPETRSSASAARAAMQLRRMALVSVSEAGGSLGRSLKGRPGSKVMSMYPASLDTFSEHVDPVDLSLRRVDETRVYRHILQWQAGESAMPRAVDQMTRDRITTLDQRRRPARVATKAASKETNDRTCEVSTKV